MTKKIQLQIPEPCHENWDAMTPVDKGRFCGSCQKQVIDFSNMTDREVAQFFKKPATGSVCGRFMNDQLNREIEIPRKRIPWIKYFFQFAIPAFMISCKAKAQGKVVVNQQVERILMTQTMGEPVESNSSELVMGTVMDEQGKPIPNVSVLIDSTDTGVKTDKRGGFSVKVREGKDKTLSFLYPGLKNATISLTGFNSSNPVFVFMKEDQVLFTGAISVFHDRESANVQVVDPDGQPVPFASIESIDTKEGWEASEEGLVAIPFKKNKDAVKLSISAAGHKLKEITIYKDDPEEITRITLERNDELQEVVVVAYGLVKKCTTTGGFVSVTKGEIISTPVTDTIWNRIFKTTGKAVLFPNPSRSNGTITISFPNHKSETLHFELMTISGQVVDSRQVIQTSGNKSMQIQLPAVSPGTYAVRLINSKGEIALNEKLIIQ